MPEISKQYNFKEEDEIYKLWEESGFFRPEAGQSWTNRSGKIKSRKKYCNVLPPPNANGELHVGHVSGYTVMDILGRFERMNGKQVLLLPGKDHAGIQTQVVYEKKIKAERGITRHDLGQEKFWQEIYDFCIGRAGYMRSQEKKLGLSADWSREKFTLDKQVSEITLQTFVKMHEDGLVYKGERIINWCPRCSTALSDIEVIHQESDGKLYYIKYPIKDSQEFIVVATTRPETMLGDTAVAVNPKDRRFEKMVGKMAILPLQNREIPIIADRRVESEFGTGAVKITPAHDPLDWKIGKDHKLFEIQVINEEAKITIEGGKYVGQKALEARENILKDLEKMGLLEKTEEFKNNISVCERCKTIIEPLISEQWFVNVDAKKYSLKRKALEAIRKNKIKFYPENFRRIMINWLENLEDWCISRQIWWGHRFPVWYKNTLPQPSPCLPDRQASKGKGAGIYVGLKSPKGQGWTQDESTFDTWFSSGQWAYSTLGFPKGKDFKNFYPSDMMVMGRDILFFWASRMIMLSLYRTKKIPFKNLFLTGLVRDKDGHKFSKSRGNGIDPLEMIGKFGADALRLSLVSDITPGQDSRLYEEKIESFRNFVTKLWNIYRYSTASSKDFKLIEKINSKDAKSLADKWIISRLQKTIQEVSLQMEKRNISIAQNLLRDFTWNDAADWYVEVHKIEKNDKVLGYVLDKVFKLWHPFTPFVTEKIWQNMNLQMHANNKNRRIDVNRKRLLMVEKWPASNKKFLDKKAEKEFEQIQEMVSKIRNLRSSYKIDPQRIIEAYGQKIQQQEILEKFGRIKISDQKISNQAMKISSEKMVLSLNLEGIIDIKKETERIEKEIQTLEGLIEKNETLLKNKNFVKNAPKSVVENNQSKTKGYKEKLAKQKELLAGLE